MQSNDLTKCVACNSSHLKPVLDLGTQPLANNLPTDRIQQEQYPLALQLCEDCYHTQLSYAVEPEKMFKFYLYLTGTSQTLRDYCDWFAQRATDSLGVGSVLDVACNDGTQLNSFQKLGWQTYGIDPAKNLAKKHNHDLEVEFCESVSRDYSVDLITAQNVLAHTRHPVKLLQKMKSWLKPGGEIQIQTSQANMFLNGEFDTMYHEHISFFCVNSMKKLAERAGLVLTSVEHTPIHGTSYLFTLKHSGVSVLGENDIDKHRYQFSTYEDFAHHARTTMVETKFAIENYKAKGYAVYGYGAAAKGITFLNAAGIKLDTILEDNEWKCGRFTPGSLIPIKTAQYNFADSEKVCVLILAWNFYDEISQKIVELMRQYHGSPATVSCITHFPQYRDEEFTC